MNGVNARLLLTNALASQPAKDGFDTGVRVCQHELTTGSQAHSSRYEVRFPTACRSNYAGTSGAGKSKGTSVAHLLIH